VGHIDGDHRRRLAGLFDLNVHHVTRIRGRLLGGRGRSRLLFARRSTRSGRDAHEHPNNNQTSNECLCLCASHVDPLEETKRSGLPPSHPPAGSLRGTSHHLARLGIPADVLFHPPPGARPTPTTRYRHSLRTLGRRRAGAAPPPPTRGTSRAPIGCPI